MASRQSGIVTPCAASAAFDSAAYVGRRAGNAADRTARV
jgi:hypothetical protein